jgi:hypothetical protein
MRSDNEYDNLRTGMTRTRVDKLIGTKGQVNGGGQGLEIRVYDACGASDAWVNLTFRQRADGSWRLTGKRDG